MGLLFVAPVLRELGRVAIKYGYKFERYGFERAYRYGGYSRRTARAVHKGYRIGTVAGSVGAGLRDAFLSSLEISDSQDKKTRKYGNTTKYQSGRRRAKTNPCKKPEQSYRRY